jgi:hypothetical protein
MGYRKEVIGTLGIMDNGFMYWYEPSGGCLIDFCLQAMALAGTT